MLEIILILLAVVVALILICVFLEPVEPRCLNCDKPAGQAPCGAMLCKQCCDRCNDMREKPCRYRKVLDENIMEGQEFD